MKIRCELLLNDHPAKLLLVAKPEEKADHLALKLAAYAMFLSQEPIVEPSSDHACLHGLDMKPDVCALDAGGQISLWIECGEVSLRKLDKITRRMPWTRILVLKASPAQAKRLRESLSEEVKYGKRVEIWTWPEGRFNEWLHALQDKTELFGEAHEKSFNLVVNHHPYSVDLVDV